MTEYSFSLIPFPDPDIPAIAISGWIARDRHLLAIHYSIAGDIETLVIPRPAAHPARQSELWTSTCFEFFLALPDQPHYWEINLSPSGDWNVFQMDAYRRAGFREEPRIEMVQFTFHRDTTQCTMDSTIDLYPIIAPGELIEAGITAVIKTIRGNETYWALAHPGPQADFHLRESFILAL
jgi:hypothetical protein